MKLTCVEAFEISLVLERAKEISLERFIAHGGTAEEWRARSTALRVLDILEEVEEAAAELS